MKKFFKWIGKIIWNGCKFLIILLLLGILGVGIFLYQKYNEPLMALKQKAEWIAKNSEREDFKASLTSVVYDSSGEKISTLRSGKDAYYLTYEEIPTYAKDVMIVNFILIVE